MATHKYGIIVAPVDLAVNKPLVNNTQSIEQFELLTGESTTSLQSEIIEGYLNKLTAQECVDNYAVCYNTHWSTLILLTERQFLHNLSSLAVGIEPNLFWAYKWMCDKWSLATCTTNVLDHAVARGNWTISAYIWWYCSWIFTAGGLNNTTLTFTTSNVTYSIIVPLSGEIIPENSPLDTDLKTLMTFYYTYNPDARHLREYLNNSNNLKDSSWAAEIAFRLYNPTRLELAMVPYIKLLPDIPVHSCLSKKAVKNCQLIFSLPMGLVVLGCNIIKVGCMFLTAHQDRGELFLSVGDAISPDSTTDGRCLMSKFNVKHGPQAWERTMPSIFREALLQWKNGHNVLTASHELTSQSLHQHLFPELLPGRYRWIHAPSLSRWILTITL